MRRTVGAVRAVLFIDQQHLRKVADDAELGMHEPQPALDRRLFERGEFFVHWQPQAEHVAVGGQVSRPGRPHVSVVGAVVPVLRARDHQRREAGAADFER